MIDDPAMATGPGGLGPQSMVGPDGRVVGLDGRPRVQPRGVRAARLRRRLYVESLKRGEAVGESLDYLRETVKGSNGKEARLSAAALLGHYRDLAKAPVDGGGLGGGNVLLLAPADLRALLGVREQRERVVDALDVLVSNGGA